MVYFWMALGVLILGAIAYMVLDPQGFFGGRSVGAAKRDELLRAAARDLGGLQASERGTLVKVDPPPGWADQAVFDQAAVLDRAGVIGLAPRGWIWVSDNGVTLVISDPDGEKVIANPGNVEMKFSELFETHYGFGYGRERLGELTMDSSFHVRCRGDGAHAANAIFAALKQR